MFLPCYDSYLNHLSYLESQFLSHLLICKNQIQCVVYWKCLSNTLYNKKVPGSPDEITTHLIRPLNDENGRLSWVVSMCGGSVPRRDLLISFPSSFILTYQSPLLRDFPARSGTSLIYPHSTPTHNSAGMIFFLTYTHHHSNITTAIAELPITL